MMNLIAQLYGDEAGFIVSAELILVSTIAVLSMIVGLSEVASAVNQELEDVAAAFGALNQSYHYYAIEGHYSRMAGTCFQDNADSCDGEWDVMSSYATEEASNW